MNTQSNSVYLLVSIFFAVGLTSFSCSEKRGSDESSSTVPDGFDRNDGGRSNRPSTSHPKLTEAPVQEDHVAIVASDHSLSVEDAIFALMANSSRSDNQRINDVSRYINISSRKGNKTSSELASFVDSNFGFGSNRSFLLRQVFASWNELDDPIKGLEAIKRLADNSIEEDSFRSAFFEKIYSSKASIEEIEELIFKVNGKREQDLIFNQIAYLMAQNYNSDTKLHDLMSSKSALNRLSAWNYAVKRPEVLYSKPDLIMKLDEGNFKLISQDIISNHFGNSSERLLALAESIPDEMRSAYFTGKVTEKWLHRDSREASKWVVALPEGRRKNEAIKEIVRYLVRNNSSSEAAAWLDQIKDDEPAKKNLRSMIDGSN